jgi:hypothetical protein
MTETDKTLGGAHAASDRGARPTDDKRAAVQTAGEAPAQFTAEQLATPAPQLAGTRQMWIIVGPYRGTVLTMPDAEAEDAKDSHWAVEMATVAPPFDAANPPEHDHALTDEDRAHAVEAANAWAAKVNAPPETAPEGETEAQRREREQRRQMPPAKPAGEYETRGTTRGTDHDDKRKSR